MSFVNDVYLTFSIQYLSVLPVFTSSYQDAFNILLLFSPELVVALSDYFYIYYFNSTIFFNASSCFDSYTSNLNYNFSETLTATFMFFFFA